MEQARVQREGELARARADADVRIAEAEAAKAAVAAVVEDARGKVDEAWMERIRAARDRASTDATKWADPGSTAGLTAKPHSCAGWTQA